MLLAHGPVSYLLNEKIQEKRIKQLGTKNSLLIAFLSMFFGILPDFDIFLLAMRDIPIYNHHLIVTHTPIFWILAWILLRVFLNLVKRVLNGHTKSFLTKDMVTVIERSFLIGTLSHIFLDSIFSTILLLYPLNYSFTVFGNVVQNNFFTGYMYSIGMAVEIFILSLFALFVYKKFFNMSSLVTVLLNIFIGFTAIYVLFTVYMVGNTYNKSVHIENGKRVYDSDMDTLVNRNDLDTDNDMVNNLGDVDYQVLSDDVISIAQENPLVSTGDTVLEKIYLKYGALNSYRVVSQAYFNQNKAIEPVLVDYYQSKNGRASYGMKIKYDEILFSYLEEKGLLTEVNESNLESSIGRVLFVKDSGNSVVNMGIVTQSGNIAMVFDTDERLTLHTLDEIRDLYPKDLLYIQM